MYWSFQRFSRSSSTVYWLRKCISASAWMELVYWREMLRNHWLSALLPFTGSQFLLIYLSNYLIDIIDWENIKHFYLSSMVNDRIRDTVCWQKISGVVINQSYVPTYFISADCNHSQCVNFRYFHVCRAILSLFLFLILDGFCCLASVDLITIMEIHIQENNDAIMLDDQLVTYFEPFKSPLRSSIH